MKRSVQASGSSCELPLPCLFGLYRSRACILALSRARAFSSVCSIWSISVFVCAPHNDAQALFHCSSEMFSATSTVFSSPGSLQIMSSPCFFTFTVIFPVPRSSWMRRIRRAVASVSLAMVLRCWFSVSCQHRSMACVAARAGLVAMSPHISGTPFRSVCPSTSSCLSAVLKCSSVCLVLLLPSTSNASVSALGSSSPATPRSKASRANARWLLHIFPNRIDAVGSSSSSTSSIRPGSGAHGVLWCNSTKSIFPAPFWLKLHVCDQLDFC